MSFESPLKTYLEALQVLDWTVPMVLEYHTLVSRGTWFLVSYLTNAKIVTHEGFIIIKYYCYDKVACLKAQLVVCSLMQACSIDCIERVINCDDPCTY